MHSAPLPSTGVSCFAALSRTYHSPVWSPSHTFYSAHSPERKLKRYQDKGTPKNVLVMFLFARYDVAMARSTAALKRPPALELPSAPAGEFVDDATGLL